MAAGNLSNSGIQEKSSDSFISTGDLIVIKNISASSIISVSEKKISRFIQNKNAKIIAYDPEDGNNSMQKPFGIRFLDTKKLFLSENFEIIIESDIAQSNNSKSSDNPTREF